jgi:hypothetical protein
MCRRRQIDNATRPLDAPHARQDHPFSGLDRCTQIFNECGISNRAERSAAALLDFELAQPAKS